MGVPGDTTTSIYGHGKGALATANITTGSRSTLQGTVFKREITTDSIQTMKDQVVSPYFFDVFDGQDTFLGALETEVDLIDGEFSIGSRYTSSKYIIETPLKRKPNFGAGTLFGLDLNLFHDNLNYNDEQSFTDIEIYKFKKEIENLTKGHFGIPSSAQGNLIVASMSATAEGGQIVDTFDGLPPLDATLSIGKTKLSTTKSKSDVGAYLELNDAWKIRNSPQGRDVSKGFPSGITEFDDAYGSTWNGRRIILLEKDPTHRNHWQPSGGRHWLYTDFNFHRGLVDWDYRNAYGHEDMNWLGPWMKFQQDASASTTISQQVDESSMKAATLTLDDTSFDYIYYTKLMTNGILEDDSFKLTAYSLPIFSNEHSPPSGTSAQFVTLASSDEDWTNNSFSFHGHEIMYQTICAILRIPKPLNLARTQKIDSFTHTFDDHDLRFSDSTPEVSHDGTHSEKLKAGMTVTGDHVPAGTIISKIKDPETYFLNKKPTDDDASGDEWTYSYDGDKPMNSVIVDIKFAIARLDNYHKSANTTTAVNGNHFLSRSFGILFATRPMSAREDLATFLAHMNMGPNEALNMKDRTNPVSGERKNLYNSVFFIRNAIREGNARSQSGTIGILHSGRTPMDHNFIGHSGSGSGTATDNPGRPPMINNRCLNNSQNYDYISLNGEQNNYAGGLGDEDKPGTEFESGKYYTMRCILNNKDTTTGYLTWILLNSNKEVCWSKRLKHQRPTMTSEGEGATPPVDITNKKSGFPCYMHIFVNGMPVGSADKYAPGRLIDTAEPDDGTGIYSGPMDSQTDVVIDSISIYGFEGEINNATIGDKSAVRSPLTMGLGAETATTIDDDYGMDNSGTYAADKTQEIGEQVVNEGSEVSPVPTYFSWGTKEDTWSNKENNIFMGGFTVEDLSKNDATDTAKSIKYTKTGSNSESDIIFLFPDDTTGLDLGGWLVEDRTSNLNADRHMNDLVTLEGENHVDKFTKKGFFTTNFFNPYGISMPNTRMTGNMVARENPAFSTKIVKISGAKTSHPKITVVNPTVLNNFKYDDFIIYRAGYNYDIGYYRDDYTVQDVQVDTGVVELGTTATTLGDLDEDAVWGAQYLYLTHDYSYLLNNSLLHELYISPKRYWFVMESYNKAELTYKTLPIKKYDYSVMTAGPLQGGMRPDNTIPGMTFKETEYSDTSVDSSRWNLAEVGGLIETEVDYGFSSGKDKDATAPDLETGIGYINKYTPVSGYNRISLDGLVDVENARLQKPDEKVTLFVSPSNSVSGVSSITTLLNYRTTRRPFFTFYYFDEKPTIVNFMVVPNEEDPFYPTFTWEAGDDDLWYGFLLLGNKEIFHQYDGAIAHIPLNEANVSTIENIHLYRYDGGRVAQRKNAVRASAETTAEGLAGNAFIGDGGITKSVIEFSPNDFTHPENEFSLIAHFTCNSLPIAPDNGYILSKRSEYEIYIDTNGNVNTTLRPSGEPYFVELKSTSVVSTDGETPTNVILTFDESIATGNVKLFVNGKLEDQSGLKTTDGSINNWPIGKNIQSNAGYLTIGMRGSDVITTEPDTGHHNGTIEEVVLYNRIIYPVVPQTGTLNVYKPLEELTTSSIGAGISNVAKLFVKDYHNIRGTLANDVASSSMISYRKTGLGLKTDG